MRKLFEAAGRFPGDPASDENILDDYARETYDTLNALSYTELDEVLLG